MASQEEHLFFPFFLYVFVSGSKPGDILVFSLILVWMPAARARIPRRIPGLLDQTKLEAENEMFLRLFPSNFEKVVKIKKKNKQSDFGRRSLGLALWEAFLGTHEDIRTGIGLRSLISLFEIVLFVSARFIFIGCHSEIWEIWSK